MVQNNENVTLATLNRSFYVNFMSETMEESSIMHQQITKAIFYTVYATTSFLGIVGNSLVLCAIARHKSMHTVQNAFIANLSTSHILLCAFSPFTLVYTLMGEWIFGSVTCFFVACAQGIGFYASSITLMCIAINRYMVLKYPCRRRPTPQATIICGIWIVSVLATVPYGISLSHMSDNAGRYFCEEVWPNEVSLRLFGAFSVLLQYVTPFAVIICCYVKISFMRVRNVSGTIETKGTSQSMVDEDKNSNERWQTNRMLIIMATIAGYSLLPLKIVNLVADIHPQFFGWKYAHFSFFVAHALATTSLCCNPILYARFSSSFQKAFTEMWPFCALKPSRSRQRRTSAPESCPVSEAMEILLSESNAHTSSSHNKIEIISVPD